MEPSQLDEYCRQRVESIFDPTKFEVSTVLGGKDEEGYYCVVDFRRRGWEADVDCKDYCYEAVEQFGYKECGDDEDCLDELERECVAECKNARSVLTGSVTFDPITLRVKESTIPTSCQNVWAEESLEELEERMVKKIREYGCEPSGTSWIHPHELVPIEMPELGYEEYPAMCYYHIEGCSLRSLAKMMEHGDI